VISGGVPINFTDAGGGLWVAPLPPALLNGTAELSTLYINGGRRLRAREPNALGLPPWSFSSLFGDAATFSMAGPLLPCDKPVFGTCPSEDAHGFFSSTSGARSPNASWGTAGAIVGVPEAWTLEYARLGAYDGATGRVSFASAIQTPVGTFGTTPGTPCGGRWFLESFRDALNAPGEYFVDSKQVLYMPLPSEVAEGPDATVAEMPALSLLWSVAGTKNAPVVGVTLRDVEVRMWGEKAGAREGYPGSYTAALHVGPYATRTALLNVTIQAGATNAVCMAGNVTSTTLDHLFVHDIGGRAVEGCAATLSYSVRETMISNCTVSHTCYNYMSGGAVAVVGTEASFLHNELYDFPLMGVVVQQAGGPSQAQAPSAQVAFNYIHDFGGRDVLSDFGGIYINSNSDSLPRTNWLAVDVHHNLIRNAASYGYGANGLYTDHGTSGAYLHHNVISGVGGRGLSPHSGLNITAVNNLFYNVSLQPFAGQMDANCVISGPQGNPPGFSATLRNNLLVQPLKGGSPPIFYTTKDKIWAPPKFLVNSDANIFWAGGVGGGIFPDGKSGETDLQGWQALTQQDMKSLEVDPQLAAPDLGNFTVLPGSPAWSLGWQAIDFSTLGPLS